MAVRGGSVSASRTPFQRSLIRCRLGACTSQLRATRRLPYRRAKRRPLLSHVCIADRRPRLKTEQRLGVCWTVQALRWATVTRKSNRRTSFKLEWILFLFKFNRSNSVAVMKSTLTVHFKMRSLLTIYYYSAFTNVWKFLYVPILCLYSARSCNT